MSTQQVKHLGCSLAGALVTVELECVSLVSANEVFRAIASGVKAGHLRIRAGRVVALCDDEEK